MFSMGKLMLLTDEWMEAYNRRKEGGKEERMEKEARQSSGGDGGVDK